jgi:putative tryptophan/tyrosine transport system substrate-binding protein
MAIDIGRRQFISTLGGVAVAWPLDARAQQPAMPVVGFLNSASVSAFEHLVPAFRDGLGEAGYVEGRNVTIEYRWAEGQIDRLPALAADLAQRQVAVMSPAAGTFRHWQPKRRRRRFRLSQPSEAIRSRRGSLRVSIDQAAISRVQPCLHIRLLSGWSYCTSSFPKPSHFDPSDPVVVLDREAVQAAAKTLGLQLRFANAGTMSELEAAFETVALDRPDGLFVGSNPFFNRQRDQLVGLAAHHTIPTIYAFREFPAAGGLISYGSRLADTYRQVGIYTGRILKGESPADLPVVQPTKFELVINLKTAQTLGINVPPTLLVLADEVIE